MESLKKGVVEITKESLVEKFRMDFGTAMEVYQRNFLQLPTEEFIMGFSMGFSTMYSLIGLEGGEAAEIALMIKKDYQAGKL